MKIVTSITKNSILIAFAFISSFLTSCSSESITEKTKRIHKEILVIDTHNDINVGFFTDSLNYSQNTNTQINLPKMISGGLDLSWLIVYTGQDSLNPPGYAKAAANAKAKFDAIHRLVNTYAPDQIGLALTAKEARDIWMSEKKVAMIGVENAYPIGLDTANVKKFYDLGARYMSLAHNGHNQFSDSNTGEYDSIYLHNGISELGKQVIEKMNYYGIMVDISHPSKESIQQTIAHSKAPVIASHSSARALCDHPRNLDNEQLELIKANGGVVQTVAFGAYLKAEKHKRFTEAKQALEKQKSQEFDFHLLSTSQERALEFKELLKYQNRYNRFSKSIKKEMQLLKQQTPPVDVADFVDHIDYMVEKIGINHVGISSDFDGGGGIEGWQDASETFNVTFELVKRGYTKKEIEKLWGGNLLRVLEEVEMVAKSLQEEG